MTLNVDAEPLPICPLCGRGQHLLAGKLPGHLINSWPESPVYCRGSWKSLADLVPGKIVTTTNTLPTTCRINGKSD